MKNLRYVLFAVMCFALLLMAGCDKPDDLNVPEVTPPAASESVNVGELAGEPVGQEPETPGVKLNADELKSLDRMLFGNKFSDNWYYRSLAVVWTEDNTPLIDLSKLFYNGIDGECDNLTKDEIAYLSVVTGISENDIAGMGQFRLPEAKMDYILREYFGITLDETARTGLENAVYYSNTGCYYLLHNDRLSVIFGLHSAYEQDNGGFIIYYGANELSPAPEYVMAVEPNDMGSYTVLYNKPVG